MATMSKRHRILEAPRSSTAARKSSGVSTSATGSLIVRRAGMEEDVYSAKEKIAQAAHVDQVLEI